ncbi:hypothetical protein ZIOFF_024795 [Zingiber officinale]|uniref:Tetratricopeptide repeat protein n=1 Tax=Zingiber officinale TaxID=94328 RepID=A0A8J5H0R7_ZINOF|nr:hypothetical protein ZIOFF_024795 [Zingiber officinale]
MDVNTKQYIKEKLWKQFQRQEKGQEVVALGLGNLAGIYYEQSQLDMAILHYKQAINCDSTFIEAYNNLSCLALQPNHPQALSSLGNIYMDWELMQKRYPVTMKFFADCLMQKR